MKNECRYSTLPDELALKKKGDGSLCWVNNQTHTRQIPPYSSTEPDKQLNEFLGWVKPDISKFYESLKIVLKRHNSDEVPDYIKISEEAFKERVPFEWLDLKDLGDIFFLGFNPETKYRVVPGKLAKNMIARIAPELSTIESKYENIYKRLNQLP